MSTKKSNAPFKAQLLSMFEGNTISLKDNDVILLSKKSSSTVESSTIS